MDCIYEFGVHVRSALYRAPDSLYMVLRQVEMGTLHCTDDVDDSMQWMLRPQVWGVAFSQTPTLIRITAVVIAVLYR